MLSERVAREKAQYDEGLRRSAYNSVLSHTEYFYREHRAKFSADILHYGDGKNVLELGSTGWARLGDSGTIPKELHCINISEVELTKGRELEEGNKNHPTFHVMDAHNLEFEDNYFDVVFGSSVLHHLNFTRALDEITRVLKSDGKMYFYEPMGINPVSKIVRALTPQARTADERPFGVAELNELKKRFQCDFFYQQLFSVPFGVLSRAMFRRPDNAMMRAVFHMDQSLSQWVPPIRLLYRNVVIVGQPLK